MSQRDSIAYPKSHGSQEPTVSSFDKLRMTGIDKFILRRAQDDRSRQAQDDRLYVTLSHTVTLNHTVTLHYTVTLSLSKRDSIAYSKSNGSQEATRASFDKLILRRAQDDKEYSSCPCGFCERLSTLVN